MTRHKHITAVLFDWDLTLAHVIGIKTFSERLQAIFHAGGLDFPLASIEAAMRSHHVDTAALKLPILPGVPQTQQDIANYYKEILWRMGYVNDDPALFDYLYNVFAELPLTLYEAALPVLQQLQQKGFTLGIITNHSRLIRPVASRYVGEYIPSEHIIISQEIQLNKPSPSIFRYAATQLRVPPANCLFVGDNLYVDAIGAVQQGGFAMGLWVDRKQNGEAKRPLPENVHRITSLIQVLDFVQM